MNTYIQHTHRFGDPPVNLLDIDADYRDALHTVFTLALTALDMDRADESQGYPNIEGLTGKSQHYLDQLSKDIYETRANM